MAFTIVRNDITRIRADAIVNTANPEPAVGRGTDSAVHAAAGPKLLSARKQIGAIAVGESAYTDAFDLPAKYVLHTVSPRWEGGEHGEAALLERAYRSTLALAKELNCRSVAFPLLSAGSYGFPPELAMQTAIHAFTDFLLENDMEIILAVFSSTAYSLAGTLFHDLKSYISDRYVEEHLKAEYPCHSNRRTENAVPAEDEASPFSAPLSCPAPIVLQGAAFVQTFDKADRKEADGSALHAAIKEKRQASVPRPREKEASVKTPDLASLLNSAESSFSEHLLSLLHPGIRAHVHTPQLHHHARRRGLQGSGALQEV